MPSHPFHSHAIRDALVTILSNRMRGAGGREGAELSGRGGSGGGGGGGRSKTTTGGRRSSHALVLVDRRSNATTNDEDDDEDDDEYDLVEGGGRVRRVLRAHSSDDDDEYDDDHYEDTDSRSSNSSSSPTVDETTEAAHDEDDDDDARMTRRGIHPEGKRGEGAGRRMRRHQVEGVDGGGSKGNRRREDDGIGARRMGNAPCVLIPLDDPSTTTGRMVAVEDDDGGVMGGGGQQRRLALAVPIALLPSYHRVRDETHASTARALLDAWDVWNGEGCRDGSSSTSSSSPTIIVVLLRSGRFASAVYAISKPNNSNRDDDDTSKSSVVTMIAHNTSTRYTIRKGQGGSQSNHDQSKNKAKSVGAQLRREGEKKLREDVHDVWREYRTRGYVSNSICVFVSCPRGMRKDYLYAPSDMSDGGGGGGGGGIKFGGLLVKGDSRWRDVPLDVGRPTLVAANAVLERLTSCEVRELSNDEWGGMMAAERRCSSITRDDDDTSIYVIARRRRDGGGEENSMPNDAKSSHAAISSVDDDGVAAVGGGRVEIENAPEPTPPYTPLHEAVMNGDLPRLMELLDLLDYSTGASSVDGCSHDVDRLAPESATAPVTTTTTTTTTVLDYDVNTPGGPDLRTPLHVASASSHPDAVAIVTALLVRGHANPCVSDGRSRKTPYFVARTDAIREAFRLARGTLGEDVWSWDDGAKVGPALTVEDVKSRRAKTMEKKRRQRARQKEARAEEKAEAEEVAAREKAELEERTKMEEARRIRDGLRPKGEGGSSSSSNACDYCQKVVRGKKRSQMFHRLEYAYCTTECVKKHQRELMAEAATRRMSCR